MSGYMCAMSPYIWGPSPFIQWLAPGRAAEHTLGTGDGCVSCRLGMNKQELFLSLLLLSFP